MLALNNAAESSFKLIMLLHNLLDFKPYQTEPLVKGAASQGCREATNVLTLEPGLYFLYTDELVTENVSMQFKGSLLEPVLIITFALKGDTSFLLPSGERFEFLENTTTIACVKSYEGQREFKADTKVFQIRLMIYRSWFESHLGKALADQLYGHDVDRKLWVQKPISLSALKTCERFSKLSMQAPFDQMEIHSLAMHLLKSEVDQLLKTLNQQESEVPFSERDKALMQQAKEIMQTEYYLPLTISDMAKRLGMNESKFKQAMQYFFSTSYFQMLTEIRMHKARELLMDSQASIALVAEQVGYHHSSNFSLAFKKFFNESPGQFRKHQISKLAADKKPV